MKSCLERVDVMFTELMLNHCQSTMIKHFSNNKPFRMTILPVQVYGDLIRVYFCMI